jgi:hypothetical protein
MEAAAEAALADGLTPAQGYKRWRDAGGGGGGYPAGGRWTTMAEANKKEFAEDAPSGARSQPGGPPQDASPLQLGQLDLETVRDRPGRLGALRVFHSKSLLCGALCMGTQGA